MNQGGPESAYTQLDWKFREEVASVHGGENLKKCYQCGTCNASCPVRHLDQKYNPRKIIRMAVLGMRDRVLSSDFIWLCSSCYTCHERCPQDVRLSEVMRAIRNLAVKEGYAHPSYLAQAEAIASHGRLYEIEEFDNKRRQRMNLPSLPTKCEEVARILELTGVDKIVRGGKS